MCSARWVYSISRRWWANVPHLCCCKCPSATGMTNVQREVLSVYWTYFVCRSTCTNTHFCFNKTECQKIVEEHSAVAGALPNGEKCWQSMLVCTVVSLGESLKLPDSFNGPCFSLGIKVANKVLQYFYSLLKCISFKYIYNDEIYMANANEILTSIIRF